MSILSFQVAELMVERRKAREFRREVEAFRDAVMIMERGNMTCKAEDIERRLNEILGEA